MKTTNATHIHEQHDGAYNPGLSLTDLLAATVGRHAAQVAIVCENDSITYQQLDEASNRLAHYLLAAGIGSTSLVPVWLNRSVDLIVAITGILKAGAAYIPVDYAYPPNRLAYILADSGANLVITDNAHRGLLPEHAGSISLSDAAVRQQPATPVPVAVSPHDLAYVIYTSGSTGNPKGVMVAHQSIQHLVTWHNQRFNVTAESKLSFVAGTSFDIAVWEIWSALAAGATLYIAHNEERTNAQLLLDYYERNRITHGFVPTILAPDVVAGSAQKQLSLSHLFTGGEKLKPVNTKDLPYTFVDYYGPTECTVYATYAVVNRPDGTYVSTIGQPLDGIQAYILNPLLEALPAGETGELCISGVCVSQGYWNNPLLTIEQFVPHPFIPGAVLYKTGDLARQLPDGNIEFIGRIDNQVKIRGYRIEPGEIESVLLKAPYVHKAVVTARENNRQHQTLVAFIVPGADMMAGEEKTAANAIRAYLKQELPGYMVPAHFIFLEEIPVTANGKTDTGRLQAYPLPQGAADGSGTTPETPMEAAIISVWADLLDQVSIDVTDNFFDIGGDSLLVAIAAIDIAREMDVKVYLRDIYQYPVVRSLAAVLTERKLAAADIPAEDIEPVTELQNDVYLAPGTVISGQFDKSVLTNPGHIFLTGVTGFIGIHLLEELLNRTTATIYCLVRAGNTYDAWRKIEGVLSNFSITIAEALKKRVVPVTGDLTQPAMGIAPQLYEQLAGTIEIIYHSASSVNFIEPYSYNKAANVAGLREVIRFATDGRLKCLALMSTISVYSWGHKFTHKTVMTEQDDIRQNILAVSKDIGYVRSKYVMEAIADLAAAQGLPVITYRLGYAICNSITGAYAPYQWWSNLVKVCLRYNAYPDLTELREGLITVDYMAQSMVHITGNPNAVGLKFNLIASPADNLTLDQFFMLLQQYYPVKLQALPYKEWRALWENDSRCELYPLTSLFKDNMHEGLSTVELYQNTYIWDNSQVKTFLEGSGIEEPVFDKALLDTYLAYLGVVFEAVPEEERQYMS